MPSWLAWLAWWRPPCLLRTVAVNLKDEPTALIGVLWRVRGPWLVLRGAEVQVQGNPPEKLAPGMSDLVIDRRNVSYIQLLP
jgi:hypothetical protein